jgi:hypothetical protein
MVRVRLCVTSSESLLTTSYNTFDDRFPLRRIAVQALPQL